MELTAKQQIISEFAINPNDTGSADVQVAVCTGRIKELTEHLKVHPKDKHSRRGLIGLVNRRRKLLNYLKRKHHDRYRDILARLQLRR